MHVSHVAEETDPACATPSQSGDISLDRDHLSEAACLCHLTDDLDFTMENQRAGRELQGQGQDDFQAWLRFRITGGNSLKIQILGPLPRPTEPELLGWSPGISVFFLQARYPGYFDG